MTARTFRPTLDALEDRCLLSTGAFLQTNLTSDIAGLALNLDRNLVTYAFAGLRVLPGGPGETAAAKRETVVTEGRGGMLSVAGGKWTTYRHIGRKLSAVDYLGSRAWFGTWARATGRGSPPAAGDAVVSASRLNTLNLFSVNPLLDRRIADADAQRRLARGKESCRRFC